MSDLSEYFNRFKIEEQPSETSCGPTCLHAVYRHFGVNEDLSALIDSIPENDDGGTLSVQLGLHALSCGFDCTIFSYNIRVFDPTWKDLDELVMADFLRQRLAHTTKRKAKVNLKAYVEYLTKGGTLQFDGLSPDLLANLLQGGSPVLTGLSSTYLYQESRHNKAGKPDAICGEPEGHFVVLLDYLPQTAEVVLADPYRVNPFCRDLIYKVDVHRLINAILLGIITYDANMLILKPKAE